MLRNDDEKHVVKRRHKHYFYKVQSLFNCYVFISIRVEKAV